MTEQTPPPRVRVTGPPRRHLGGHHNDPAREIDAETELGEVFMRSLLREQLRLAILALSVLALTLGLVPLAFAVFPELSRVQVGSMPLAWVLLGVLTYPWLVLVGWWYVRRAEANERDFADLVGDTEGDAPQEHS